MSERYQKRGTIPSFMAVNENTREYIIANAIPCSYEEERFIKRYKEYYEKWKNALVMSSCGLPTLSGSVSSLRDELDYWDNTSMANTIYQRELLKKR